MRRLSDEQVARNTVKVIAEAGGRAFLAGHFNTTHWAVNKWYHTGRIPADRIKDVCRLANGNRGDLYWKPELLLRDSQ